MNRRSAAFALIAILALTQFGSQLATAETAATIADSAPVTVFEISNLKDEDIIRVDLVLQPAGKVIEPILRDVALGDRHDQTFMNLFTVEMEKLPPDAKAHPAMLIRVKPRSLQQGSYKLRIELRPLKPVVADKSQAPAKPAKAAVPKSTTIAPVVAKEPPSVTIELKLPDTKIKTADKLVINQVWHGILTDDPPALNLTGTSGQNIRLTDVKIHQTDLSGKETVASSLKVNFASVPEIAPGDTKSSAITLVGTFPLGTSTGAALITAPQLKDPVWITFDVKARRAKWIIVAVMMLGLFLGFAVRIWVKKRMELQEARLKAFAAYEIIEREAKRPDAEFGRLVNPSLVALDTAIKHGNVEALNKAITDANTVLAAAIADLNSRRDIAKRQLETLTRLAKNRPMLPIAIAEAITIDGAALETARGLLGTDDVAGAQQSMKPSITTLGDALGDAASTWRGNAKSMLDQAIISAFLSEAVSTSLTTEKETLKVKLDESVPTTDDSSLDDIATLFDLLRNARRIVSEFVNRAGAQLANSLNSLKSQFDLVPGPQPDSIKDAFKKAAELLGKFPAWAERPEIGTNELQKALDDLTTLWRAALPAQITGTDAELVNDTKERIETLLQQNHYRDAAFEVIVFLKYHPLDDNILGETGDHSVAKASETFSLSAGIWSFLDLISGKPSDTSLTMVSTVREQIPPSLEALRTRTLKELILGKLVTFAIASLIIMGIGYSLFAQTFVGTFNELMSVFVWAFGLNISIDGVVESMKKTKLE
jgi:hypothetical protein